MIAKGLIEREASNEAIKYFADNCEKLTDYSYWYMLSTCWVSYSENYDLQKWKELFSSGRGKREKSIMKPSELEALKALPYVIKCYRAHKRNETDWISYTTNIETAISFARQKGTEEIKEYYIKKRDVLAYFTRRSENEIICLNKEKAEFMRTIKIECEEGKR